MAAYKDFAINNGLTVDYGYTYGFYKGFYISIKENFGSSKELVLVLDICKDKDILKQVLSVYENTLERYCLVDMERNEEYIKFSFNLGSEKATLLVDFLDKFIDSYLSVVGEPTILCHLCKKEINKDDGYSTIDYKGVLMPVHKDCVSQSASRIKEEVKKKINEINADRNSYFVGFLGALGFSLIYILLLGLGFLFTQFILNNYTEGDVGLSENVIQYIPAIICLAASPIINAGYELAKGKKGTGKFFIVSGILLVTTIVGIFLSFSFSLSIFHDYDFGETIKLVLEIASPGSGALAFRRAFSIYFITSLIFGALSLLLTFNSKKAQEETKATTYDKLD